MSNHKQVMREAFKKEYGISIEAALCQHDNSILANAFILGFISALPEGHISVPVEPTSDMAKVGACYITSKDSDTERYYSAVEVYKQMVKSFNRVDGTRQAAAQRQQDDARVSDHEIG